MDPPKVFPKYHRRRFFWRRPLVVGLCVSALLNLVLLRSAVSRGAAVEESKRAWSAERLRADALAFRVKESELETGVALKRVGVAEERAAGLEENLHSSTLQAKTLQDKYDSEKLSQAEHGSGPHFGGEGGSQLWQTLWGARQEAHNDLGDYLKAQGAIVTEGGSADTMENTLYLLLLTFMTQPQTICEIGFNSGHGAATMLLGTLGTRSRYIGFTIDQKVSRVAEEHLQDVFGAGRVKIVYGDSKRSVPAFFAEHPEVKCDLVHVDGDHSFEGALADLKAMAGHVSPRHVLIADDARCQSPTGACKGVTRAWEEVIKSGLVDEHGCVSTSAWQNIRGWCWGGYPEGGKSVVARENRVFANGVRPGGLGELTRFWQ